MNADFYCKQLNRINQPLIEKWPAIDNRKGITVQHDNARQHYSTRNLEKNYGFGDGRYYLSFHSQLTLCYRIPTYSGRYNTFYAK